MECSCFVYGINSLREIPRNVLYRFMGVRRDQLYCKSERSNPALATTLSLKEARK